MACRKRDVEEELGKPQTLLDGENLGRWYTAPEAPKGKPGNGSMLDPEPRCRTHDREAEEYCQRESPPDVEGESYRAEYSAVGKARHTGKVSTEARSPERTLIPDMSDRNRMSQPPCGPYQTGCNLATVQPCAVASATEEPDA